MLDWLAIRKTGRPIKSKSGPKIHSINPIEIAPTDAGQKNILRPVINDNKRDVGCNRNPNANPQSKENKRMNI